MGFSFVTANKESMTLEMLIQSDYLKCSCQNPFYFHTLGRLSYVPLVCVCTSLFTLVKVAQTHT